MRSPAVAAALGEPSEPGGIYSFAANTNIVGHAGRTLALVESGVTCYELTTELDTIGVWNGDGRLRGGYTAHPHRDPATGALHAVSYELGRTEVEYSVIGADGRTERTELIDVGGTPLMHDFSLTEDYVVLYDLPVTFEVGDLLPPELPRPLRTPTRRLLSALLGRVRVPDPLAARLPRDPADRRLPYRWNPDRPARVGVLPRAGRAADVRWFEVPPCYAFHTMNAYQDGAAVVADLVRYDRMFDIDRTGPGETMPALERWVIDLAAGTVRQQRLDDQGQEFPRFDERRTGHRYRYGYAISVGAGLHNGDVLYKHDLCSGSAAARSFGSGMELGEFVFQPAAPDAAEDDGVLLGFVTDRAADRTHLAILDAGSLESLAAVQLPHRVPAGFHGNWLPTDF
ncbi:Carotenoid cleavage oxygenase [Skermania piniformis]